MSLLRKKAWWQKLLYSRLALLMAMICLVALSLAVYDRWITEHEVANRRAETEQNLMIAEARKQEIEKKVTAISDDAGVESEIRKHFDVAREGEKVVVLVGDQEADTIVPIIIENESDHHWWSWLVSLWPL